MSVSGISSTSLMDYVAQSAQNKKQELQKEFQQLGKDLQSGNLSAAQSDFATLQKLQPQSSSTSSSQSSPIAQEFSQLSQDLQSGNLSAAQSDYTTLQQDFQSHGSHHRANAKVAANAISQQLSQLGQDLQSGDLTSAQQAYSALQQYFQQFAQNSNLAQKTSTTSNLSTSV